VQWTANDRAGARLGMAVSARAAGNAVNRNRIRRLIRESFRMHREELPAVDVLVTARAGCAQAANREIFASLAGFWRALGSPR
jgi:ribonuclease P protein component